MAYFFMGEGMKKLRIKQGRLSFFLKEFAVLFVVIACCYCWYSLLFFHTAGLTTSGMKGVGRCGVFVAVLLTYLFGFTAHGVMGAWAYLLYRWVRFPRQVAEHVRDLFFILLMLIAGLGIAALLHDGGAVGRFVLFQLKGWLGKTGSLMFLCCATWWALLGLVGIALGTRLAWGVCAFFCFLQGVILCFFGVLNFFFEKMYTICLLFVAFFSLLHRSVIVFGQVIFQTGSAYTARLTSLLHEVFLMISTQMRESLNGSPTRFPVMTEWSWLRDSLQEKISDQTYYQDNVLDYSQESISDPTDDLLEDLEHGAQQRHDTLSEDEVRMRDETDHEKVFSDERELSEQADLELLFTQPEKNLDEAGFARLCQERAHKLEEKLALFGVKGSVVSILPGPVITLFEYRPESSSKISKIIALEDDLALALTAHSIRIIAPIPGRDVVGFEIANHERKMVYFSELVASSFYKKSSAQLPLIFGVNVTGEPVILDLLQMPHLLIGGTTGSGKSVGMNTMLMSLLCRKKPEELRLILIDPKRLEFSPYADVPHLHVPIITDAQRAARVLQWLVQEMERRYELLAKMAVRTVLEYQQRAQQDKTLEPMPFIVLMIDELADLMMVCAKEVEGSLTRLAQMSRAAGIHLIVATQRPSVDVVTGIIKVNFPSRVSFRVSSKIDSRTILDRAGAEKLLGKGDMLCMYATASTVQRVHGCYLSMEDIQRYTDFLRSQGKPNYLDLETVLRSVTQANKRERDVLYPDILEYLKTVGELSISSLQRQYNIGFNRSAQIIEHLEDDGLIAPAQGNKPRKVIRS